MLSPFCHFLLLWSSLLAFTSDGLTIPKWNIIMQVLSDPKAYRPAPGVTRKTFTAQPTPYVCIKEKDDKAFFHATENPDAPSSSVLMMQAIVKGCRTSTTRIRGWCFKNECKAPKEIQIGVVTGGDVYSVYVLDGVKNNIKNTPVTISDPGYTFNNTISSIALANAPGMYLCLTSPLLSSHLDKTLNTYDYLLERACVMNTKPSNGACVKPCAYPQSYGAKIVLSPSVSVTATKLTYQKNEPWMIRFQYTISQATAYSYLSRNIWANFGFLCYKVYDPRKLFGTIQRPVTKNTQLVTYEFQGCRYQWQLSTAYGQCQKNCKSERFVVTIQYGRSNIVGKLTDVRIKSSLIEGTKVTYNDYN